METKSPIPGFSTADQRDLLLGNPAGAVSLAPDSVWYSADANTTPMLEAQDASTTGTKWGPSGTFGSTGGTVSWSIAGAGLTNQTGQSFFTGQTVALSNFLPADFATQITNAFAAWAQVANISFVQVADSGGNFGVGTTGNIRIGGGFIDGFSANGSVVGRAFFPPSGGTANAVATNGDLIFDSGDAGHWNDALLFATALHEIGHTLGLNHVPQNNPLAVMNPTLHIGLPLQPDDIAGVQSIYGPASQPLSDAPHTFTYISGHMTFVGGSGIDTLDLSGFSHATLINLNVSGTQVFTTDASTLSQGSWRSIVDLTSVENIVGANANTTFYGDTHNNTFTYVGGHDVFGGGGGTDTLDLSGFNSAAVLINLSVGGNNVATTDAPTLQTGAWRALVDVTNAQNVIGADSNTTFFGNTHNNTFTYVGGHDVFDGGGGTDTLDLSGFGSGAVLVNLTIGGNNVATTDAPTLQTGAWRPLVDATGVENVILSQGNTTFYGDTRDNVVTAEGGDHFLVGGGGSDTFIFHTNFAHDTIYDFAPGDLIQFDHSQFADFAAILAHTADDGQGNATIAYDASHSLTLNHVLRADLVTTEFLIA